jgi:FlaA1/EpsC-like NDP-sugar epimerase
MFERILVTGTGGSHALVAERFIELLRLHNASFDHVAVPRLGTLASYDCVVHFGGFSAGVFDVDVASTKHLLSKLKKSKKLKRIITVGSAAEYGACKRPASETTKPSPDSPYGIARLRQSALIEAFARAQNVKTLNLRLFNILGVPKQKSSGTPGSLIESLVEQFGHSFNGTVQISNAKSERDFVDIDDAVQAIWHALHTTKGGIYELMNISSGKGTSLGAVVRAFGTLCNRVFQLEQKTPHADSSVGKNTKAQRMLGWVPTVSLKVSLEKLFAARKRVLIVGAGVAAEKVLEEIKKEDRPDIYIVGLLDDNAKKQGTSLSGVPIIGVVDDVAYAVKKHKAAQVLISTPSVGREVLRRVVERLPAGFPVKVLPSISSVILGTVDLTNIRDIDLSDLIGRPLVKADQQRIAESARGKSFLVTGGAGSIGSEVVRQLYHSNAKKIIVVDSWEEGIYHLLEEFGDHGVEGRSRFHAYVGNVRDLERLEEIASFHKIDAIIHAAAYKHVPLMEENISEAHKTNILGTTNVLAMAVKNKIKDFLLISTDKAVNPVSVMGKSKRQAELLLKEYAGRHAGHRMCAVRFGNVLNSSGSVVPKFMKQIKSRSPLTVTHRDMTRFFMSIPEAVSLVLQSWIIAKNGQILVLDMGEQVRIIDLAETLIRLHGLEPHVDIEIRETGMRKGERLREELLHESNVLRPTPIARIFVAEELLPAHVKRKDHPLGAALVPKPAVAVREPFRRRRPATSPTQEPEAS